MRVSRLLHRRRDEEAPTLNDVYRIYGLAMESAQVLEQIVRGHASAVEWASMADDFSGEVFSRLERLEGRTIGWVQNQKHYDLPDDIRDLVTASRQVRNVLAHNYFATIDKHSVEGRRTAIAMLSFAIRLFGQTGQALLWTHVPTPDKTTQHREPASGS
jgi:hypothetical protein